MHFIQGFEIMNQDIHNIISLNMISFKYPLLFGYAWSLLELLASLKPCEARSRGQETMSFHEK